jgi:phosphoribosylformimino-5-aminoimidazole carboxamide ribonucleotide (ProFAR) isomerase
MPFDVIPAIDLWQGRLATMGPDGGVPIDAYAGDPLAAAEEFILEGASWLHVVDLDLAFTGRPANLQSISLLAVMDARIQASGGIVTEDHVSAALAAGAQRAVLGSAALADRALVDRLVDRFGEGLAVAVEVEGDRIRPRGRPDVDLPLDETVSWLASTGATRFVHVAVDRVGELSGPDLDGAARVAFTTQRPVIVSGGIAREAHVAAAASEAPLVQGVILGRALYDGELTIREAIRAAMEAGEAGG